MYHYCVMQSTSLDSWITQLRKGLLDVCILNVLAGGESYGYELIRRLREVKDLSIGESTAYPILHRLKVEGYVRVRTAASPAGPPRRYFSLTSQGQRRVREMNAYLTQLLGEISRLGRTKGDSRGNPGPSAEED